MSEEFDRGRIRELNDQFRQTFEGGQVLMTPGVQSLAADTVGKALRAIQEFDDWTEENDPWQTHEFGAVEVDETTVWFKIDAYDRDLEYGSPNPADPDVTNRVMTVLLPSEY